MLSAPRAVALGGRLVARAGRAPARGRVRFERRAAGGRWHVVASRTADSRGRAVLRDRPPGRRDFFEYRVRVAGVRVSAARRVRTRTVLLAAVGDVNLGDGPGARIAVHGAAWPWRSVGPVLRAADIASANLECAVSTRGRAVPKRYRFRGRPSSLRAARREAGLDLVVLANNHSGDYGTRALGDTLRLSRRYGLRPIGAGRDLSAALQPVVVERYGLRVGFVAFSQILPTFFFASATRPGTAFASPANVRRAIRAARRRADVVVAQFHWGIERTTHPVAVQRSLAAVAFAAGADAVIGHHPHVLQPIRRLPGRRLVAWSLGNFVFGASSVATSSTGILQLRLSGYGVEGAGFRRARIRDTRPLLQRR